MNNKGVTLIELLAVVVIMGLILIMAIPSMLRIGEEGAQKQYEQTVQILESAVTSYIENVNPKGLNLPGQSIIITLDDLRREKLITIPFINPLTEEEIPLDAAIIITKLKDRKYKFDLPL